MLHHMRETSREQHSLATQDHSYIVGPTDRVLVTGAAGFIGSAVVQTLLSRGFRDVIAFVRPSSNLTRLEVIHQNLPPGARLQLVRGNLLSSGDCEAACQDVSVIFHVAAGTGDKSFPDAFLNSVVATRNLLEAGLHGANLRRVVLVSSFAVYTNRQKSRTLDESCEIEQRPELRDAYCYAKVKQEDCVVEYGSKGIPHVIVRPGSVYGGKSAMTGRVGISTFGPFLHLGGSNKIPLTYVDNCAEAIVLAGIVEGVEHEVFNIVDDDLPSSRQFLRQYKKCVHNFRSFYIPHPASYAICYLWEKYSKWSRGQLPPVFTRRRWYSEWKRTRYTNDKLKLRLGWAQKVPTEEALRRYFENYVDGGSNA